MRSTCANVRRYALPMLALVGLAVIASPAAAKVQVGQTYPMSVESARNYPGSPDGQAKQVWDYEIVHPDATYISVHFKDFELAPGDFLLISDASGGQAYTLEGRGKMSAGEFWARHVSGDTLRLQLIASSPDGAQGFVIDEIAAGFGDVGGSPEAICGADDKENAICYASSHPTEYHESRAVARLLISGAWLCTGWLASADNHLVTNEHCITSASEALNTDYEFMSEAPNCTSSNCQLCWAGDIYSGAAFLQDNAALDYSLVQINSGDPAALYGYLQIDDRQAVVGEEIYIPQHPGGRAKELAIASSQASDTGGVCHVTTTSSPPCSGSGYNDVGYYCDTEGGSSGSPVIARSSHKVIALHHCANCPNRGVPIGLVYAEISGFLGPECTVDGDCDDGLFCNGVETCVDQSCVAGGDPCPGQNCVESDDSCVDTACGDGTCDPGEDCNSCRADCISGNGGFCGNGTCEPSLGEDCVSCSQDCNGAQNGNPNRRYCCGDGDGENPVGCGDSRCASGGAACSNTPAGSFCCGDGTCEGSETSGNCLVDCPPPSCGDGTCDPGEACTCSPDCGSPPLEQCSDGVDNDCDGAVDCDDADCSFAAACQPCQPRGGTCNADSDCCSGGCKRNGTCR